MIFKGHRRRFLKILLRYASQNGGAMCVAGSMPLAVTLPQLERHFQDVHDLRPDLRAAKLIHLSVSMAQQDRGLTPTELGEISRQTTERLNLADGPWQAWVHTDGHTLHLHVVASSIRFDGTRVETRSHVLHDYRRVARELELEHGLWRVGDKKGDPVLPPLTEVPKTGGPTIHVPVIDNGFQLGVKDAVYSLLRDHPGLALPEFAERLAQRGITLVPSFSAGGTRISGLGYRAEGGRFDLSSKIDKKFSLAGLQSLGVSYEPIRDLPRLALPAKPQSIFIPPPVVIPVLALTHPPPPRRPRLTPPPPQLQGAKYVRQSHTTIQEIALTVAARIWETLRTAPFPAITPSPARCPRP